MSKNLKHSKSKKLKIGGPGLTECVFVKHEILREKSKKKLHPYYILSSAKDIPLRNLISLQNKWGNGAS